jgi:hypothetical protein
LSRARLALLFVVTIALGIASRRLPLGVGLWDKSLGDALYAVAVFLVLAFVFPAASIVRLAIAAFAVCFAIELFQRTGIPSELARTRPWVHWILGSGFAWHDVGCYAVGVVFIAGIARWCGGGGGE